VLEIRLPRGRIESGVVRDARGAPVPDILVGVALLGEPTPWVLQETVVSTDSAGEFTLDSLPLAGGQVVAVRQQSPVPGTLTDAGRERITIVVPDRARIPDA